MLFKDLEVFPVWLRALLAVAAIFIATFAPGLSSAAELMDVRFGAPTKQATRVVFDLSGAADYAISGDEQGNGRLIVDFSELSAKDVVAGGQGHVGEYRVSTANGGVRVILTLSRSAKIKEQFTLEPAGEVRKHRLVIDLETADKAAFMKSLPQRYADLTRMLEAVTAPTKAAEMAPQFPIVVIDAGHGGADPGASGPGGVQEKTVTLAAAKKLKEILQKRARYQIVMTRADDTRLSVDERSKAARDAGARLFISLHADAHGDAALRGGSVYTLSEQGSQRSAREALSQGDYKLNGTNLGEENPVLGGILFDLTQRETKTISARFAEILVKKLIGVTPLVNNSHRTGDLYVLLSPDVPAVLFELAFISNKSDVDNLMSPAWRERAMTAVADAIDEYFEGVHESRHAAYVAPQRP